MARKTGELVEAVMTHFIQFICCLPCKNLYKESCLCVWGLKSLFGFVKKNNNNQPTYLDSLTTKLSLALCAETKIFAESIHLK